MKIILPSNGVLGCKSVDLRQPKFEDIRNVSNLNQEEALLQALFIKELLPPEFDLSKITKFDIDYLFAIVAYSCQFNTAQYNFKCECGHVIRKEFSIVDKEVIELEKIKLPHLKRINGVLLSYTILSAQQHIDACEYALSKEDFKTAYEDAVACFTLGKSLDDISYVTNLDIGIYLSAHLFQQVSFHGLNFLEDVKCPQCSKVSHLDIQPNSDYIRISIEDLMKHFASVASVMSFDTFVDFTIPEFRAFIEAMNSKLG